MTFSFRIHVFIGNRARILDDRSELPLWSDGVCEVSLKTAQRDVPLKDTGDVILRGSGWAIEDEAAQVGERWNSAIVFGFAHRAMGVDLRLREKGGGASPAGLEMARQQFGFSADTQVFYDKPGVQTHMTEPPARFIRFTATGIKSPATDGFVDSITRSAQLGVEATPQQLLAFDLYCASFNVDIPDVRLMCLMMAAECLIEQQPRSSDMHAIINDAIAKAEALDDDTAARDSFVGSLRYLRNESISGAGRRLAKALDHGITYMDEDPDVFFTNCYNMRSSLAHGVSTDKRPSPSDVDIRAASLEIMIGDLLSVPLLGIQQGRALGAAAP